MTDMFSDDDVACELTTGTVLCGSVSRALKHRKPDSSKTSSNQSPVWCPHIALIMPILMVCSAKVLCPQNLFSSKLQGYKSCVNLCVLLCEHTTFVLLTAALTMTTVERNKHFCQITGNKYSMLLCSKEVTKA